MTEPVQHVDEDTEANKIDNILLKMKNSASDVATVRIYDKRKVATEYDPNVQYYIKNSDGKFSDVSIDIKDAPEFATQYKHDDYKIYDYVTKLYGEPTVYVDKRNNNVVTLKYNNTRINKHESKLSSDLIKIGVFNNKHIPSEYKYGSVE